MSQLYARRPVAAACSTDHRPRAPNLKSVSNLRVTDMLSADLLNPLPKNGANIGTRHTASAHAVGRRPEVAGGVRPVGGYLVAERHPRSAVYRITAPQQLGDELPAPAVLCGI